MEAALQSTPGLYERRAGARAGSWDAAGDRTADGACMPALALRLSSSSRHPVPESLDLSEPRIRRRPCRVDGCPGLRYVRGYCQRHYTRWLRHGDPSITLMLRPRQSLARRLSQSIQTRHVGKPCECGFSMWRAVRRSGTYYYCRHCGRHERPAVVRPAVAGTVTHATLSDEAKLVVLFRRRLIRCWWRTRQPGEYLMEMSTGLTLRARARELDKLLGAMHV
jgi:hypothetical protein